MYYNYFVIFFISMNVITFLGSNNGQTFSFSMYTLFHLINNYRPFFSIFNLNCMKKLPENSKSVKI